MNLNELNELERKASQLDREIQRLRRSLENLTEKRKRWQADLTKRLITFNSNDDRGYSWVREMEEDVNKVLNPVLDELAPDLLRTAELHLESCIRGMKAQSEALRHRIAAHIIDTEPEPEHEAIGAEGTE